MSIKVDRTCPRCRAWRMHWAAKKGLWWFITCVECGHEWKGRLKVEEYT